MMDASLDAFKWDDEDERKDYEALKSPEEILGEAFSELDQLNAAMVQLAPGKIDSLIEFGMKGILLQLLATLPSVTVGCPCRPWRSPLLP